jgi:hypothetical protein
MTMVHLKMTLKELALLLCNDGYILIVIIIMQALLCASVSVNNC